MRWTRIWGRAAEARVAALVLGGALALGLCGLDLSGCGMPGAPQPPSLNLPDRVTDLSAERSGDRVTLTWTMPKRNTDKLLLKDPIEARVCRRRSVDGGCETAAVQSFAPGADATFTETLPPPLAAGAPRVLSYFVELENRKKRSAGLSNGAEVLAGEAPAEVMGLGAQMRRDGVLLAWTPAAGQDDQTQIRLVRRLLTPATKTQTGKAQSPLTPPPEPLEQSLLVPAGPAGPASSASPASVDRGTAIDKDIRFGESYEYRAQRVAQVTVESEKLELDGPLSAPVRIDAAQLFPPAAPVGLAAVATAAGDGSPAAIDLSWQPNTEPDLAGYAVYRRDADAAGEAAWQRISPAQPVVGPGFHDDHVQPGQTYAYAVSAIDQEGHESARSAETEETVPNS
jgi:hypothetical protein